MGGMKTLPEVIALLGGNKGVAEIFGVRSSAVSNWRAAGRFPERLHLQVDRLCKERGIDYDPASDPEQCKSAA